jgi:hypothetical protein
MIRIALALIVGVVMASAAAGCKVSGEVGDTATHVAPAR